MISKEEFLEWKNSMVTQEFLKSIELRIEEIKENLVVSAGVEPLQDRFLAGMVHAYKEVKDVAMEEMEIGDA